MADNMRRLIAFPCEGERLLGTLDAAEGSSTGLLIVSGGNEVRAGAHRGMAHLARRIAEAGHPVLRFDRRGVGDSAGENGGWSSSGPDIAAALAAFRCEQPHLTKVVALGNCDAATALACVTSIGLDGMILTNPWTGEDTDGLPSAAAIRKRYARRVLEADMWRRLLTGRLVWRRLLAGIDKLVQPRSSYLPGNIGRGLDGFAGPVAIVLATGDGTAIGFREWWRKGDEFARLRRRATLIEIPTSSHSFQRPADAEALEAAVLAALR